MPPFSWTQEGDLECTRENQFTIQLYSCILRERSPSGLSSNSINKHEGQERNSFFFLVRNFTKVMPRGISRDIL